MNVEKRDIYLLSTTQAALFPPLYPAHNRIIIFKCDLSEPRLSHVQVWLNGNRMNPDHYFDVHILQSSEPIPFIFGDQHDVYIWAPKELEAEEIDKLRKRIQDL